MVTGVAIGIAVMLAGLYIGLPYHQAHQRRKQLERKNRESQNQRALEEDAV